MIKLADQGVVDAIAADKGLQHGLSVRHGQITEPAVADALGRPYTEPLDTLRLTRRHPCEKPMPQPGGLRHSS